MSLFPRSTARDARAWTLRRTVAVLALASSLGFATGSTEAADDSDLKAIWTSATQLMVNEAYAGFQRVRAADDADAREADFGLALMLLNKQPKTEANIQQAADLLTEVGAGGDDDLSVLAAYYRARVEQVHRFDPDAAAAIALYNSLIESHPGHPIAEVAISKRAVLEIYDDSPLEAKRARLERLAALAPTLRYPPARRDLHLLLADSYARLFQDDQNTLAALLAADADGIERPKNRSDVWVRIGELARLTGQPELARRYYEKFLESFRRDNRTFTVRQRLEALPSPPTL